MAKRAARALGPIELVLGRKHGQKTLSLYSVHFPRPVWSLGAARAWLKRHRFRSSVATLPRMLHAAQADPKSFKRGSFRTIATAGHEHIDQNPRLVVDRRAMNDAVKLYRKFREKDPEQIDVVRLERPKVLMVIGRTRAVEYITDHAGKPVTYRHTFAPSAMPTLCASSNGRALYFVGGNYDFTRDGIVDRKG